MANLYDEALSDLTKELDRADTQTLYLGITKYLLNLEEFNKLRLLCKRLSLSSETTKAIKYKILNDHRIAATLKFTMIYCRARQIYRQQVDVGTVFAINGLSKHDLKLFEMLDTASLKVLDKNIRAIPGDKIYPAKYWQKQCSAVIGDGGFQTTVTKFCRARLSFVATSNNWTMGDMVSELNCKAVETFYRVAPFRDELYLKNTAIRSVYNHGIKTIKKFTTKKRGRLNRDEDGSFYNVVRTYEVVDDNGNVGISDAILNRVADTSMYAAVDRKLDINQLVRENPNAKQLIQIITRDHYKPFEEYCQQTFNKGAEQLMNGNSGKAYVTALAGFCNLPYHMAMHYINKTCRRLVDGQFFGNSAIG